MFRCVNLKALICHLRNTHNKDIEMLEKDFESLSAFLVWKGEEEKRHNSSYVRQCAPQTTSSGTVKRHYYYCHRSGKYSSKATGSWHLKVQGSCKVGDVCTAHIKVSHNLITNAVHVEYCFTHHSHETNLAHLKMPDDLKTMIAAKLQEGVSEKKILDDIRDDVPSQIGREHLVTMQDIQNIRRQ